MITHPTFHTLIGVLAGTKLAHHIWCAIPTLFFTVKSYFVHIIQSIRSLSLLRYSIINSFVGPKIVGPSDNNDIALLSLFHNLMKVITLDGYKTVP